MADNLTIFGTTYNNVTGIKATDTNGVVQTFIKGGSPAPAPSSVSSGAKFIDYDGTVLHTYTTAEALALSSLPANPSHTGLTAQGWNWSLANIKAYLTKYPNGIVNVGQMYITDDGKTRIYIHLGEERKSPMLGLYVNGTVDVDWGDETTHDTLTGTSATSTVKWTPTHDYANGGDYVIKLTVTGTAGLGGTITTNNYAYILRNDTETDPVNLYYLTAIKKVELGNNIGIGSNVAFMGCYAVASITLPNSITQIGSNAFQYCYSLTGLTIPDDVTSIGANAFSYCYSLTSLTIPNGVTSFGNYIFYNCYSLTSLTIPDNVTSIGSYTFSYCYSLTSLIIPDNLTSIGAYMFGYCSSLTSLKIPDNVTSIGTYAFQYCHSLTNLTIPDDVTSIGTYAFQYCYSLTSLTIPDGVTTIGSYMFRNSYGIAEYHFLQTTPPTLSNINAFSGIPDDCIIYVPYSADHSILNAYKTASNWSTYADYMQEEQQS